MQQTPAELVDDVMGMIRAQFYAGAKPGVWQQDQHYIRREVVLWPASWLREKGMVLPAGDYKRLLVEKLVDMKAHMQVAKFTYLPAYLRQCVQSHFRVHEDAIYAQAKAVQAPLAAVLRGIKPGAAPDVIEPLSAAHAVLVSHRKAKKPAAVGDCQRTLF